MRNIAVISDTHGTVPDRLLTHLSEADEIWHLGDVTRPDILIPIQNLGRPLIVVNGNCDPRGTWPETRQLEREGCTFHLQHRPPPIAIPSNDAILFGHLHRPIDETMDGIRILNPGAITGPRHGSASSFAWLRFPEPGKWTWKVTAL
ncbi:metallophosphoesterase family protein [Pelagicoccus mobilis]|uniref:Metallophosphoesterase family protein n=1 Tax=Pelagicoccus mobilis TaxID=415221 RepID=A0A934VQK9_9BACT|nr:metallophosphoesterase family protein [Pelagicoccus mobilis]MBK1876604.1 metallophosphoesterase family protein [Pelagicoccus mobilis]